MIIVLTGASGSGKTTLMKQLQADIPGAKPLESYTTRSKRASDVEGELTYISEGEFKKQLDAGEFLWAEKPFNTTYWYGTRRRAVDEALDSGVYIPLLAGTAPKKLFCYAQEVNKINKVLFLFLYIADQDELRRRLGEDPSRIDVEKRLAAAGAENEYAHSSGVPFKIIDATQSKDAVFEEALAFIRLLEQ